MYDVQFCDKGQKVFERKIQPNAWKSIKSLPWVMMHFQITNGSPESLTEIVVNKELVELVGEDAVCMNGTDG